MASNYNPLGSEIELYLLFLESSVFDTSYQIIKSFTFDNEG